MREGEHGGGSNISLLSRAHTQHTSTISPHLLEGRRRAAQHAKRSFSGCVHSSPPPFFETTPHKIPRPRRHTPLRRCARRLVGGGGLDVPPPEFGCCGALAFSRQDSSSLSPCIRRPRGYFFLNKVTVCVRFFFRFIPTPLTPPSRRYTTRDFYSPGHRFPGGERGRAARRNADSVFFGFADSIVEVRAARARRTRTVDKHTESG